MIESEQASNLALPSQAAEERENRSATAFQSAEPKDALR